MLSNDIATLGHTAIAPDEGSSYNVNLLGISLAVGRLTLDNSQTNELLSKFLDARREGLSPKTLAFYEGCLVRAPIGIRVTASDIDTFLLYSSRSGYKLNPQDNPILLVEAPKVEKRILPSLSLEQVNYLIEVVDNLRDKTIISLFADSGIRLNELAAIKSTDIDW